MFFSNVSTRDENSELNRSRLSVGIPIDDHHNNARIQSAVNHYNGSPIKSLRLYKNRPVTNTLSPNKSNGCNDLYPGVGNFPLVRLDKSPLIKPVRRINKPDFKIHIPEMPVNRLLACTSSNEELRPTRSVLDVLQDLSRKRIHSKTDEDLNKRIRRGLGGDAPVDVEAPYKPLFIQQTIVEPKPTIDKTTQTLDSIEPSIPQTDECKDNQKLTPAEERRLQLRRQLAKKNNEITASLSSSKSFLFTPYKRKSELELSQNYGLKKRQKIRNSEEIIDVISNLKDTVDVSSNIESNYSKKVSKSPGTTSPKEDRYMTIFYNMQDSTLSKKDLYQKNNLTSEPTKPDNSTKADDVSPLSPMALGTPAIEQKPENNSEVKKVDLAGFNFGNVSKSNENNEEKASDNVKPQESSPSFSFGIKSSHPTAVSLTVTPSSSTNSKLMMSPVTSANEKPSFAFNSTNVAASTVSTNDIPSFVAVNPETTMNQQNVSTIVATSISKPVLDFGSTITSSNEKPAFSFGSNVNTTSSGNPTLSFGLPTNAAATEKLTFNIPTDPVKITSTASSIPNFNFGVTSSAQKPNFSFGLTTAATPEKPSGLNTLSNTVAPTVSSSNDKPLFNFGSTLGQPTTTSTPGFGQAITVLSSFGQSASAPSIEQTNTSNFGQINVPSTGTASTNLTQPNNLSGFGLTSTATITFGQTTTTSSSFGQTATAPSTFGQTATAPGTFGQAATAPSTFGQTATAPSTFGQTATAPSTFGQTATAPSTFGQTAPGGFGIAASATNPNNFGQSTTAQLGFASTTTPLSITGQAVSSGFGQNMAPPPSYSQALTNTTPFSFAASKPPTSFGHTTLSSPPSYEKTVSPFGSTNPQSTPSFGATNPQSTPSFGATSPQSTPSFGATNPQSTLSFGANNPQSTPSFGAANPQSTPSFGANNPQSTPFGAANPQSTPSFGATNPQSTPSFGATNPQSTPTFATANPQALFGPNPTTTNNNNKPLFAFGNQNPSSTAIKFAPFKGSLGQPNPPAPQTSAFPSSTAAPVNSSFQFGPSSTATPQTNQFATSAFNSGQSNPPQFGANNNFAVNQNQTPPAPFNFNTPTTTAANTGFGFNSSAAPATQASFNFSTNPTQQPSLFPTASNTTPASFSFGATNTPAADNKPVFAFGSNQQQPSTGSTGTSSSGFSFGSNTPASSGFNFSSPSPSTGFNFGSSTGTGPPPVFPFGQQPQPSPGGMFGTPSPSLSQGTFSIGSGSTQPRPKVMRSRRRNRD